MRVLLIAVSFALAAPPVFAQSPVAASAAPAATQPRGAGARQSRALPPPDRFAVRGYGMAGVHWFTASQTFSAVTGSGSGAIWGGGLRVHVPGGAYLDVGAWRYSADGERVFVDGSRQVYPLGIPATVSVTPFEVTAGWRFPGLVRRLTPHVGVGYTSLAYEETGGFAEAGEDVTERYSGYHVVGGVEVRLHRWAGLVAEGAWTSVKDGLGEAGASKAFGEDNLGGTTLRLKLVLGR
ncbi:MAG: hypothetical protein R2708_06590 [Vicinamibacterales bacterium]